MSTQLRSPNREAVGSEGCEMGTDNETNAAIFPSMIESFFFSISHLDQNHPSPCPMIKSEACTLFAILHDQFPPFHVVNEGRKKKSSLHALQGIIEGDITTIQTFASDNDVFLNFSTFIFIEKKKNHKTIQNISLHYYFSMSQLFLFPPHKCLRDVFHS